MPRAIQQRIEVQDRGSDKVKKAARAVTGLGRAWQTTGRVTTRAMRLIDRGFARLGKGMQTLMRRAKFMMLGFQLTATIMATSMVRSAMQYERALRNVTSLMAGAGMNQAEIEKNFRQMDGSIRRLAVSLGQAPEDLASGMYNVVSATFDGASGLEVLKWSAKGALAGLSDTNTVTGLMTKTLQAYRKEGETNAQVAAQSADVMDTYFMAVNRGMFTFDDLAQKMGALPATANAFGISLQDLMAFLSTATVRGMDLDEAIVGVRQALLQIGAATPQVEKAAKELFGDSWKEVWSAEALAKNGLYGTMQNLSKVLPDIPASLMEAAIAAEDDGANGFDVLAKATGQSVEALAALFPNIRALKAIMAVSGPGMALYAENMDYMGERAGATDRALGEMEKSGALAMQKFKSVMSVIGLDLGGLVLPVLSTMGNSVVDWYGGLQQRFAEEGGLFKDDAWLEGVPDSQAEEQMKIAAQRYWDNATPGERLGYTLRNAWSDALTNLKNWFDGGGKKKVEEIAAKFGRIIADGLKGLAGLDGGDISDSLPAQFGKALLDGFTSAFKDFDWVGFFQSTFGTAIATVLGGMFAGPGGAIGGFAAAKTGVNPLVGIGGGALLWKMLPKLLAGGAAASGGGAGAAGGAAAAAAGGAITLSATTVLFTAAASLAAGYAFAKLIDKLIPDTGNEGVNGGSAEITRANNVTAQARVDAGEDPFAVMNSTMGARMGRPGAYGLSGGMAVPNGINLSNPLEGKVWDAATKSFVDAAAPMEDAGKTQSVASDRMARAVTMFGGWVRSMPYLTGSVGGVSGGATGSGFTEGVDGPKRHGARGYSGMVYGRTNFVAGEGGRPEHVQITPTNAGVGASGGRSVTIEAGAIVITGVSDPKAAAAAVVRELEKAIGNG